MTAEARETIRRLWPVVGPTAIAFRVETTPAVVRRIAADLGLGPSPFRLKKPRAERN
jgi:hypothetical protein